MNLQEDNLNEDNDDPPPGEIVLFFGNRNSNSDWIFEAEMKTHVEEKTLSHLFTAFSREKKEKYYVTHEMEKHQVLIFDALIKKKGYLYICGDALRMAADVDFMLKKIIKKVGDLEDEEVDKIVKTCIQQGRYVRDIWS